MRMNITTPVFILGSGRCGTFQISKLFDEFKNTSAHHEFLFDHILQTSVLYKMNKIEVSLVRDLIVNTHKSEILLSDSEIWIDSSNALPWIADVILDIFPDAKFVHLIRDGRKVVSSFYNKFEDVMYDKNYVIKLKNWLDNPQEAIKPSPYKNYWRPLPGYGKDFIEANPKDRFEYLCWYWAEINSHIDSFKDNVDNNNFMHIKLEDLVANKESFDSFINFIGLESHSELFQKIKKPMNVAEPKNYLLTKEQAVVFENICGGVAKKFGYYGKDEYAVKY